MIPSEHAARRFVKAIFTMLAYLRFDIALVARNLLTVAASRIQIKSGDARMDIGLFPFLRHATDKIEYIVGLLLLTLIVSALFKSPPTHRLWVNWWAIVVVTAVCGIDAAFLMTNGTQESTPLIGCFALLLVSEISTRYRNADLGYRGTYGLLCAIGLIGGLLLFLPNAGVDLASLVYAAGQKALGSPPTAVFATPRLQTLAVRDVHADWDEPSHRKYIQQVNNGMALVQKFSSPTESVFALDYVSPFSYGLARQPAIGGGPYTGGALLNSAHMPSPDWFLGQVDILMIAKDPPYPERVEWLKRMFGKYIDGAFDFTTESSSWILLRRKAKK